MFKIVLFLAVVLFISCKKKPEDIYKKPDIPQNTSQHSKIIYVLNEGLFNQNNSTVTLYYPDSANVLQDLFHTVNGRNLGDTGNDIAIYGSKIYMVITGSGQIEVTDSKSFQSLKQISLSNNGINKQPRKILFHNSLAFVSCFDGTVAVFDTASFSVTQYIKVGRNPESMVVYNNRLYVSNSGGLDAPDYDHTVSVIDLNSLKEISKIEVGINPGKVTVDSHGDLYVISKGNHSDIPSKLKIFDLKTEKLKKVFDFSASGITINGDSALVSHYNFNSGISRLMLLNVYTDEVININFIDLGEFQTLYSVKTDPENGDIYLADARMYINRGKVIVFNNRGEKKSEFQAGLNPGHILIVRKR